MRLFVIKKIKYIFQKVLLLEDALPLFEKKNSISKSFVNFRLYNFGIENKNKVFYVIRRSPGAGMFSNFIYVLNHLEVAEKNNFIPIVDMENFTTIYNEKEKINNTYNAWEYYFEKLNKYTLSEVYNSQNVIITENLFHDTFSHNICNQRFRKLGKEKLKVKKNILNQANNFFKKNLFGKTLAVHYRGTSYKTSANHPYPTPIKETIDYIKFLKKKHGYNKIFLCTEDLNFFNSMKKNFKTNLFYFNSFRSKKDDAFKIYPRNKHRFKLGLEILLEALVISKCQGFLHAVTNVSMYVKYLDQNNYIKYFKLDSGTNTSNEFLAPYMWFYKNFAPRIMGGFKKKIF